MAEVGKNKRKLKGVVVSDSMDRTRVVAVTRLVRHKRYKKYHRVTKRYKAHDDRNEYKKGEAVIIEEERPLSKGKRWRIVRKVG